jgi:hypothetical protein
MCTVCKNLKIEKMKIKFRPPQNLRKPVILSSHPIEPISTNRMVPLELTHHSSRPLFCRSKVGHFQPESRRSADARIWGRAHLIARLTTTSPPRHHHVTITSHSRGVFTWYPRVKFTCRPHVDPRVDLTCN